MEKNKFNFSKLAALFTDYPALKIGEISYSYQQINDLIQRKLTDYSHSSKTVITLINDSPLNLLLILSQLSKVEITHLSWINLLRKSLLNSDLSLRILCF